MKQAYWIQPKDKAKLLAAMMEELADGSQILFEGDFTGCDFTKVEKKITSISGELQPVNEDEFSVKVFELDSESVKRILEQILPEKRFEKKIRHIQIQKNGELQFLVGDNFHEECISVGPLITVEFLDNLKSKGVIEGYQTDAEAKAKYP